jgi:adenylate cyclase
LDGIEDLGITQARDGMPRDESTGPGPSLITELRHRGVIGVAVVYAIVGWTLVQVADAVFPALALPDWSVTLVVALVLLGFPLALVLAWAFERSGGGVRRAPAAPGRLVAAAFVLGAAGMSALTFALAHGRVGSAGEMSYSAIAVLPFEDLSPGDQSYFSEGIAEELMAMLASVPDLDVVGRASAFAFRDRTVGVAQIGEQLGVDAVLDGSVRRDDADLRISVQLIDVATDRVLWSRRYDRQAGDIFALQDEIAAAVAGEVETRLSLPAPAEADPARIQAHDLYLRGLAAWHRRTQADMLEAGRLFRRAVATDSTYPPAHAGVALTHALLPLFEANPAGFDQETGVAGVAAEHAATAQAAAHRALELDPSLAEAHAALSQRAMVLTWDRETAVAEARRAIELRPSYATGWQWYAEALLSQGAVDEGMVAIDRAIELDPLAPAPRNIRAAILYLAGDQAEAVRRVRIARQRFPDVALFPDALLSMGLCSADTMLILEGARGLDPPPPEEVVADILKAVGAPGGSAARRQTLEQLAGTFPYVARFKLVMLMAALGEEELALRELERGVADGRDRSLLYYLPMPCLDPIRDDPRYRTVLDRLP